MYNAGRVAETFDCSWLDVRKCIMIARNYLLLRNIGAAVNPQHYTLIDLATSTKSVREAVFRLSAEGTFIFRRKAQRSLHAFVSRDDRIIRNPDDFRVLAKVAASGDGDFLKSVTSGSLSLEEASEQTRA